MEQVHATEGMLNTLNTNILYHIEHIEHTSRHYWFYDPVMSLPMWNGVFPSKK